eukprot:8409223-Pyramimonas_sp.AAC.1
MGKVRAAMTDLLKPRGYDVFSDGFGGCMYTLRKKDDPASPAQLRTVDDGNKIEMELELDVLREFGAHQHAEAFREAAAVQLRQPFRR